MADTTPSNRWAHRVLFLLLVAVIAFAQLLPLHPGPARLPGPDAMLLLTLAWLIRRPDAVPVLAIAAVFVVADLLFMRPPGLWAAIVLVITEMVRSRITSFRDMGLGMEWLVVAGYIAAATVAFAAIQAVFFVPQPAFAQTLIRLGFTVAAYPLVVLLGARVFGLRKPASGEFNPLGARA